MEYIWGGSSNQDVNQIIGAWVSKKTWGRSDLVFPEYKSLGVIKNNQLIAGVIYHDYKPESRTVEFSGAAIDPMWLSGPTLHYMFHYPFEQLKCQCVATGNGPDNTRLHRQLNALSFKRHDLECMWGLNQDAIYWTLIEERWRSNRLFQRARKFAEERENVENERTNAA